MGERAVRATGVLGALASAVLALAAALLLAAGPAQASCAAAIVLDGVLYEPAAVTAPIVLGAEVEGAFYPPCDDGGSIPETTGTIAAWRVQGLDASYLARGTEDSDLFVSTGERYEPPVPASAGLGRLLGWLLAIAFVAVIVAVVRAVWDRKDRRDGRYRPDRWDRPL